MSDSDARLGDGDGQESGEEDAGNTDRPDISKLTEKSASINNIVEANAGLDEGGPELARCVLVTENGAKVNFTMDQDTAHEFALELSDDVVDRRHLEAEFDNAE